MSKETILLVNRSDIVPLLEESKILMSIRLCICFQLVIGRTIGRTKSDYFLLNPLSVSDVILRSHGTSIFCP